MAMLIEPLASTRRSPGFNGGLWVNPDLSPIEARTLPRDVADRSIDAADEAGPGRVGV